MYKKTKLLRRWCTQEQFALDDYDMPFQILTLIDCFTNTQRCCNFLKKKEPNHKQFDIFDLSDWNRALHPNTKLSSSDDAIIKDKSFR